MDLKASVAHLFAPRADGTVDRLVVYVGLCHLAMQTGNFQKVEKAATSEAKLHLKMTGEWSAENPDLATVGQRLQAVKPGKFWKLLVVAIQYLDRQLWDDEFYRLGAHLQTIDLPAEFSEQVYRLLREPEAPIMGWIRDAGLRALSRRADQIGFDLPSLLDLRWRLFPMGGFAPLEAKFTEGLPAHTELALRRVVKEQSLKIALASPLDGLDYTFISYKDEDSEAGLRPYRFSDLCCSSDEAKVRIRSVLAVCRAEKVTVLVYPELTFDATLITALRHELRNDESEYPVMVVAGSFHEQTDDDAGEFVNRCRVFDHDGDEIKSLRHEKMKAFQLTQEDLAGMDGDRRQQLRDKLGLAEDGGGIERIAEACRLHIVDTPLGRMVTAICLDFCGDVISRLVKASAVNLAWVPTMSPTLRRFHESVKSFGEYGNTSTFVVNSEWLLEALGVDSEARKELRVICYLPYHKGTCRVLEPVKGHSDLRLFSVCEIIFGSGPKNTVH